MSSIQELKVVRVYRALNTILQLCHDRGYVVRHPSAVATAVQDPALYDPEEGLDYDWFLSHFVITPERAAEMQTAAAVTSSNKKSSEKDKASPTASSRGGGSSGTDPKVQQAGGEGEEAAVDLEDASEVMRRAAKGEWICMRNAMRLACSVDPTRASARSSLVKATTGEKSAGGLSTAEAKAASKAAKNSLMVFFSAESKLTMKEVLACRGKAMDKSAVSMIIVTNKVEPGVRLDVQELSGRMDATTGEPLLSIQVFEEEALAFNVVRHETVPRHETMSTAEADAFLAEKKLNIAQLPRMLESDPLVQYLGLQRGSIVRITREGKQSGPYHMYRHVI